MKCVNFVIPVGSTMRRGVEPTLGWDPILDPTRVCLFVAALSENSHRESFFIFDVLRRPIPDKRG
jgi:hypothetical protein